ncbi:hypothetical protein JDV02_008777 [Purpureocillium takamizusanense]|uniref:Peptidase A1 domain-containing protein n=1 Tax=Purpureocillium takamizusanense TaxID=2060973 RepID=A0A9Q8QMQ6_9HYPO|nr:uncharacterized protein JDV02_008777 [Purpureocillium takamizusanense]UNI22933.1 hypothetical protein JDV02_008777 [Purpureocillium takamizusanense]
MAPTSLLVLVALALAVQSLPQSLHDEGIRGDAFTLAAEEDSTVLSRRSLPAAIENSMSMGTLPVPHGKRREPSHVQDSERPAQDGPQDVHVENIFGREFPAVDSLPGTLTLPVIHAASPGIGKRTLEVQLENRSDVAYYAQLSIGTPPQKVFAQLDTGSFELWVNPNCSGLPGTDRRFCLAIGRYDPANSSTAVVSEVGTSLRYGIGSANITYVLDDISLGGGGATTMKRVQFGVAKTSENQFAGILGLGYGRGLNTGYDNFVDQLALQKVTSTKAFSVALGSKDEGQGIVVFGGVDTSKFAGRLAPLPIIPRDKSPDGVARYWVTMKGMRHLAADGTATDLLPQPASSGSNNNNKQGSMSVFLDTGATLTLLPPAVAGGLAAAMGSKTMDLNGFYIVDCALAGRNGSVDFAFEGVTVRVPYRELIREVSARPPMCYLGVMPSETFALLGDTFLRSAYVVFDLDANMTYMAPYTNCGSTVRTIVPNSDLKSLVGECSKGPSGVNGGANEGERPGGEKPSGGVGLRRDTAWMYCCVVALMSGLFAF